jgi:hypothetical protein
VSILSKDRRMKWKMIVNNDYMRIQKDGDSGFFLSIGAKYSWRN